MSTHVRDHVTAWWNRVLWHADAAVDDPDPVHIHQFRTHLRRIRSLLGHLNGLLPDPPATQVRTTLRQVAMRTGRLRDLDVLRIEREDWLEVLPPELTAGGQEVWNHLDQEHARSRELVEGYLVGDHFRGQRLATDRALPVLFADPDRVLDPALLEAVARRHRKITRAATKLTAATEAERWHRLRIQAKKLRYSLEACPATDARKEALALLKKLQKALGDFNDVAVQRVLLEQLAADEWTVDGLQALGAWRKWLHDEQVARQAALPGALALYAGKRSDSLIATITGLKAKRAQG